MQTFNAQFIFISANQQMMHCFENDKPYKSYPISTGKNGLGERYGSECTPRGWHCIYSKIGLNAPVNSVFIARQWTGEIYTPELAAQFPERDWILTRILQLDGLEEGRNKGGEVDSLRRCIYIHGTPDTTDLGKPGSRGCIRMRNADLIELVNWVALDTKVCIE
ncbi:MULTISPECIES: L,D-transpeptidase [Legionella]|uniref:Putative ErfK/YbiS/YcfS/YnhG protein n=2 Tax=Legionella maceachernii TaxID=466 RepID=A0A0W0WDH6_9GAMM|nr:L,D-transpeptidase [Legionella maceachernii]KTD30410.1 putative ErfK/YbiS/YcfS/YnhG protein [Legionella maceachernii]SJZ69866.1 L,D-transpeptidase catalytic domain [Legionella maceachernii]SUP02234.1 Putative L,D-transpeptidase YkuD [Legionella maceachernii]